MLRIAALSLILWAVEARAQAPERVDLELVLLADASGSIDDVEIALQREGYAAAMADPQAVSYTHLDVYKRQAAVPHCTIMKMHRNPLSKAANWAPGRET